MGLAPLPLQRTMLDQPEPAPAPASPNTTNRAYVGRVREPPPGWSDGVPEADIPTWEQLWMAAHDNAELNSAVNGGDQALWRAYDDIIRRGRAVGLQSLYNPVERAERRHDPDDLNIDRTDPFAEWHARANEQIQNNPALAEALGPITRQALAGMADQLRRDALAKYTEMRELRGQGFFSLDTLADLSAGMTASVRDPVQLATLPAGMGSKTVVGAVVKEAAVNAGIEVALQPLIIPDQVRIGNIATWEHGLQAAAANVATAGAFGGLIGGAGKSVELGVSAGWNALPSVKRNKLMRGWLDELDSMRFNDEVIQRHVMGMVSDHVENGGPVRMTRTMAEAFREAATLAVNPTASARLEEIADQIDQEVEAQNNPALPDSFERAREAMTALARTMDGERPEDAAIIRKAMYDAERDYETMRQRPEGVSADEFADAIEAADARVRGLQAFMDRPQRMVDAPERTLDTTDDGPTPKAGERLTEDGKPVEFTRFDPRELGVAPDEMQYKRYAGEEGVNNAISDVGAWHAPSSGKVLVFERANGEKVIVDGHQRRALARQMMDAQGRDDIRLDGYLYREADGWTAADMRLKGAQKNIREGRSDVLDTAQALREQPNAIDASFPVSRSNIRQARQLARLSPDAWDLTRAGVLEPQYAALIGQVAPDRPEIHGPLARTLVEAAPENVRQAENIVSEALLDYAERDVSTQASLFGDDNLGRAVMYKERAQIMDAAYAWLRSERSVFKALVEKGDIARALGNELVDAANLNAKDQVELGIAAIMHSRKAGVRTAVSDMISRALDSVRREGVTPTRAGQQVAREIRALIEERGFRALLDAEGPRPPEMAEAGPLFDGPGSKAHAEQADMLEGDLRPEGREDPGVDLAKAVATPDPVTSLVDELKGAGEGAGARNPEQVLADIRRLLAPPKTEGAAKTVDPVKEARDGFRRFEQAETALREALAGLTDAQRLSLVKMQYPDAYAPLTRLEGLDLEDAIVGRVMAGEVLFARRGDAGSDITYNKFHSDVLTAKENKIVEMALNGIPNIDIAIEVMSTTGSVRKMLVVAKKKLAAAGTPVEITPGAIGASIEGFQPGAARMAVNELMEKGLKSAQIHERLLARGMKISHASVHQYASRWRQAKLKGVNFARRDGVSTSGMTPEELADEISVEFGDGASAMIRTGEINIMDTPPKGFPADSMARTDAKGRVTLFSSNVGRGEVRGLILHEVGVHAGLERVLGVQGKADLLDALRERMQAGDESVLTAFRRVPADTPPAHVMEETLAYLVHHAPKNTFVQQMFADLRAWLYRTFPKLRDWMTLTDADLQSLALGAVRNRIRQRAQTANAPEPLQLEMGDRLFGVGRPDQLGFITSAERALSNLPPRFRDAKRLTAEQWRKAMREGGASKEAFTWQIEPALALLKDQGLTGDITREAFEEAMGRVRGTLSEPPKTRQAYSSRSKRTITVDNETEYGRYTASGDGSRYQQRVFILPENQGQGYTSHNWKTPNPVGHVRYTDRAAATGERVRHVEELQSDLHQDGAKYGYKGEGAKQDIASLHAQWDAASARYREWAQATPERRDLIHRSSLPREVYYEQAIEEISDPTGQELYRTALNIKRQIIDFDIGKSAQPPRAPLENWEEPFVRFALLQAVNDGVEVVTFPTHATLHSALQNEGTKAFYDERLPNTLARVAKSLGLKVETVILDTIPRSGEYRYINGDGYVDFFETGWPASVPAIRLTPEAGAKLQEGVVMYARRGGRDADAAVGYEQTRAGGVVSTSDTSRARRPRNGSGSAQESSGTEVSGGAGRPGRAGVSGPGAAGKGAAQRGDGVAGASPGRYVATEALPDPPASAAGRAWNEQWDLTPDERLARREQFRDFVDNAVIEHTDEMVPTDFLFKDGGRVVGRSRVVPMRDWTVATPEGAHKSLSKALDLSETRVSAELYNGEAIIYDSHVAGSLRSTGLGQKLYMHAIDQMLAEGRVVNSDVSMSANAIALWKSLRAHGYEVVQRVPDSRLERDGRGQWSAKEDGNDSPSIFFVARKKPAAPELPEPTRDVMNRINEARDLAEHIPACIKGKKGK